MEKDLLELQRKSKLHKQFMQNLIRICQKGSQDIQQTRSNIQDYILKKFNQQDHQIYKELQKFLNEAFKLTFIRNRPKFQIFNSQTILKGINYIENYLQMIKKMRQFNENPKIYFNKFYEFCIILYQNNPLSILWINESGQTFIQPLIMYCQSKQAYILKFLDKFKPSLISTVYSKLHVQTVLYRILKAIINSYANHEKLARNVLDQIKQQQIDLNQGNFDQNGNYEQQLIKCGLKEQEIYKIIENKKDLNKQQRTIPYVIYDLQKKGNIKKINFDQNFDQSIKQTLSNIYQKQSQTISHQNGDLNIELQAGICYATLKSNHQQFHGILVPKIQPFVEDYSWQIFQANTWRILTLKDQRMESLMQMSKKKKNFQFILNNQNLKLQIDIEKLKVYKIIRNQHNKEQRHDYGILFWKPILKSKKLRSMNEMTIQNQDDEAEDTILMSEGHNFFKNKKQSQLINFQQTKQYCCLGIMRNHLPNCNFLITTQQNIIAQDNQSINKIDRWLNQQLRYLIDESFYGDSNQSFNISLQINNKQILKKVREVFLKFVSEILQINLVIVGNKLEVRRIKNRTQLVEDYVKYLIAIQKLNSSAENYVLKTSEDNVNKIQQIIMKENHSMIKSKKIDKNTIQLIGNNQKITNIIKAINQQNEITQIFSNLKMLNEYQEKYNSEYQKITKHIKIKELQELQDSFEGTGTKLNLSLFWSNFKEFMNKYGKEKYEQQIVKIKFPQASKDYQIFQSILQNRPNTSIHLSPPDLQVHTLKKYETEVIMYLNQKVNQIKFEMKQKSQTSFQLKFIQDSLSRCIQKILREELQKLKTYQKKNIGYVEVDLTSINPRAYTFTLKRGSKDQTDTFHKIKRHLLTCLNQYTAAFKQLRKTNELKAKTLNQLRRVKIRTNQQRKTLKHLIQIYQVKINKLIEQIFEKKKIQLEKEFCQFLLLKNFTQNFQWKGKQKMQTQFIQQNNGIFADYMIQLIELKAITSKLTQKDIKQRKNHIIQRLQIDLLRLDQLLLNNQLDYQQFKSVLISLKSLVATYLGSNLPIVHHLQNFAKLIQKHDNIIVKVGTGSGKSTVLPPFLVGMGYKRVIVTQPRRLPCKMIYKRIQQTHSTDLVGYSYAGTKQNSQNPLHYTTDGLLKVLLYANPQMIKQIDVLMLDQIHQRSKNIDFILSKIPELRKINPKLKVILCSATLDQSIVKIIDDQNNYATFTVEVKRFLIKEFKIEFTSILQKANELSGLLKKNQKMLIFFPGIQEVQISVKIFKQKYKKNAFPLHGAQRNRQQDEIIQNGQIFIATSIAQTSLTFQNLKYVLDSRKARYVYFDENLGIYVTKQTIASKSSAQQRKGRVGRDCPGQYHYQDNLQTSLSQQSQYDCTQLDRIDLTNAVFQLLIQCKDIKEVEKILKKLMKDSQNFRKKFEYSKKMLKQYKILSSSGNLLNFAQDILSFGNLNDIRYNVALANSYSYCCSFEIIAIVSFMMYGSKIVQKVLQQIPSNLIHPSGDIMTLCQYLLNISENIRLKQLSLREIHSQASNYANINRKSYFLILVKILKQMKRLMLNVASIERANSWKKVSQCLVQNAFKNDFYFHQINLGGQKGNYSKLRQDLQYYCNKNRYNQIHYKISDKSLVFQKKHQDLPPVVLSLSSYCNTVEDGILSFCCLFEGAIKKQIQLIYECNDQEIPYSHKIQTIKEKQVFNQQVLKPRSSYNFPTFRIKDAFDGVLSYFKGLGHKINNQKISINLTELLQHQITQSNRRRPNSISADRAQDLKKLYSQINLNDIFNPLKYEYENSYNIQITIPFHRGQSLEIENANNRLVKEIMKRISSFFSWFIRCQSICIEDKKVEPQLLNKKKIDPTIAEGIEKRINMIVDSSIDYHIVKSWAYNNIMHYCNRTMRMVAVCWILVTKFDCTIKGGFVRDWIVRNHQNLPQGDLTQIIQRTPRNGHLEVVDQSVSPLDIDADLPIKKLFNIRKFYQEMRKLGIKMEVSSPEQCTNGPDYWRIHIVFDKGSATGGFTAELIQPYCQISHDRCDFDVNLFYVKKDWKNAIGLKIPLKLRPLNPNLKFKNNQTLQELIINCIDRKMKQINPEVGFDRLQKFKARGWLIDQTKYEPTIYQSDITIKFKVPIEQFQKAVPQFKAKFPNAQINSIEQLKNSNWDQCYDSVRHWISNQGCKTNEKLLFHGSKDGGVSGILKNGFDSRFFNKTGNFGRGAYFADDPKHSHSYTDIRPDFGNNRCIFVCKVALGNQQNCTSTQYNKLGPAPGYHSIYGIVGGHQQYIIDRFGQAKPVFLIRYR